jgi:hypothetical protein
MGSSTNKTTTTSGSASPQVTATVNKLAKGISDAYHPGASSYVAPSSTTTGGWQNSLNAANNPNFASGIAGALSSFGNRAAGNELGQNDPGYAALRAKLTDDTLSNVNSIFTGSGRFGSGSHVNSAASGLADSLAGLDYKQYGDSLARQSEAANMLPQLFAAGQLPSSIQQSVGASMDADKKAQEAGVWDYLNRATGTVTGAAGAAGTSTTTSTPTAPLWQQLLGVGLSFL